MARSHRIDWLDEAIAKVMPGSPPKPDYEAWRQANVQALDSLKQRAQQNAQRNAGSPAALNLGRRIMARPIAKLALAAAILIVVAVGVQVLHMPFGGTGRAFAQVCRSVEESSTIQFHALVRAPNGETFTGRVYEKDGYLVRTEMDLGDDAPWNTILRDRRADRSLYLDTRSKKAWQPGPELRIADATPNVYRLFKDFQHAPGYSVRDLGKKRIDERAVVGFRLSKTDASAGRVEYSVWADPETMRPVRIDFTGQTPEGGTIQQTITDIVFDEPLEDSLFDFQPQGYQMNPPTQEQGTEQSSTDATSAPTAPEVGQGEPAADGTEAAAAVADKPPAAEPQTGVAGVVLEKLTQKPIEGALVSYKTSDPNASVRADASGRFLLTGMEPSEQRYIAIVAGGFISQRIVLQVSAGRIREGVRVEMDPGSRIEGIVRDPQGAPIAGATVATFHFTNLPAVTGPDGRFEIDGLNPVVDSYSLHTTHPGYPAVQQSFSPAPVGQTVRHDVVLRPGVDVYGTVTNARGDAIQGVTVANTTSGAMWNCIRGQTDADGRYRLENVETGELVLWAVHGRCAPLVQRTRLEEGQTERRIDIQLDDARILRGQVVDGAGAPVTGAIVKMEEYEGVRNWDRAWRRCDPNGRFVIENAPVEGDLSLWIFGDGITGTGYKVDLGQDEHLITVTRAGRIFARVVDAATGEPIPEFKVKMTFSQVGHSSAGYAAVWNREGFVFRSSQGLFDTGREDLPVGGEYRMTVSAEGYDALTLDPVQVQPVSEDPNRTVFALTTATLLAGVVVDEQGNPIQDAMVALFSESERYEPAHWRRFTTDADGIFVVSGVGSDQHYVYITAPDHAPAYRKRADLETTDDQPTRITLSKGARIFGLVVDGQGKPMVAVEVRASKTADSSTGMDYPHLSVDKTAKPDPNGYYELSGLSTGRVDVWVQKDTGQSVARKRVSLASGQSLRVDFGNEEGFSVRGVVRRGPAPVAGVGIQIGTADDGDRMDLTDEAGRFHFWGIPAGQAEITVNWPQDPQGGSSRMPSSERRTVYVQGDMNLDIDAGAGTISGTVPMSFKGREGLRISVRRNVPTSVDADVQVTQAWENVHRANADMLIRDNGDFTCGHVCAGRYYLVLTDKEHTLGITDVFDLGDSEHKQGVLFRTGRGRFNPRVVDAGTGQGIGGTVVHLENDLEWTFADRRLTADGMPRTMTDSQGRIPYDELPAGRYRVLCYAQGYLRIASEFATVHDGGSTDVTIALSPAALIAFKLSERLAGRVDTDSLCVQCRVTDLATGALIPAGAGVYASYEHSVTVSLKKPNVENESALHLPEGRYRIEYSLRPFDTVRRIMHVSFEEGTVTAEPRAGQTTTITLDE